MSFYSFQVEGVFKKKNKTKTRKRDTRLFFVYKSLGDKKQTGSRRSGERFLKESQSKTTEKQFFLECFMGKETKEWKIKPQSFFLAPENS